MATEDGDRQRWHQALVFALLGRRMQELGSQPAPDVETVHDLLQRDPGTAAVHEHARRRLQSGQVWPHPVPADLMAGLGFAQFAAALQLLQGRLGLGPALRSARVGRAQPADDRERKLLEEVPPHHGG